MLDAVATALGGRVEVRLSWNGEGLDRLLDAGHATLVEIVVGRLEAAAWDVAPEVSFNVWGERGSIDVLARHPATGALLVVEVKSVVPDVQATLATLDRKVRIASRVARDRGWRTVSVSRLLVIGEDRTARRRVEAFEATFRRVFPVRGSAVDQWLRHPDATRPMAGLRFLSGARQTSTRHRAAAGPGPEATRSSSPAPQARR